MGVKERERKVWERDVGWLGVVFKFLGVRVS